MRVATAKKSIHDYIANNIENGVWPEGFKLPTERQLAFEFQLARNTLRAVLDDFEARGQIVREVGRGTFVAASATRKANAQDDPLAGISAAGPSDVMEVRLMFEPMSASLAATRANEDEIARMRSCLARSVIAETLVDYEFRVGELHAAIMAATRNQLLADYSAAINHVRVQERWLQLKERTLTKTRRTLYQQQHADIVDAIAERNADGAGRAMREHLAIVRDHLLSPSEDIQTGDVPVS